jgi:rubrerythrin
MRISLNAFDIFDAAIMLEERGANFYASAAAGFSGEERALLARLAEMETGHADTFKKMKLQAEQNAVTRTPVTDAESRAYLDALTSDRIFVNDCKPLAGDSYETILTKAMAIEKNSVFFYSAVKDLLEQKLDCQTVQHLVDEEIGHFQMLCRALAVWQQKQQDFQ